MISEHKILNIFAENLRNFRRLKKLTQEDLADLSGISDSYIGMLERAERNVTIVNLEKLAKTLGVSYDQLLLENYKKEK